MRIDKSLLVTSDYRTDTGNMMSRLEPGDVVSAKVLEISPEKAVLRLSDGTVMEARTAEPLDVKPGQTISLTVTSRNENSFVLETVKNTSQAISAESGKLIKMLEAAGIKVNDLNLKLAAEFLKYGAEPTAEGISEALESMKGPDGLDMDKAVFLAVKNVSTKQADRNILSDFLGGGLKLGQLLESLSKALDIDGRNITAGEKQTGTGNPASGTSNDVMVSGTPDLPSQQAEPSAPDMKDISSVPGKTITSALDLTDADPNSISGTDQIDNDLPDLTGEDAVRRSDQSPAATDQPKAVLSPENTINPGTRAEAGRTAQDPKSAAVPGERGPAVSIKDISGRISGHTHPSGDLSSPGQIDAAGVKNIIGSAEIKQGIESSPEEALERLNGSIDRLFVKIHKQLSGRELDPENTKNSISELVKELRQLIQSPDSSRTVTEKAALALSRLEDTIRLLDMFSSNNVFYFQMPVKIENHRTTAELYVMKRNKSKKKIDPNDSVLFLSLDTDNLGRVETILDVKGRSISMSLRTESQAVSDFIRENIKNLYTALSDSGYKLADIKYSIMDAAATPAKQEKLLTDAVRMKHGKVDLRI